MFILISSHERGGRKSMVMIDMLPLLIFICSTLLVSSSSAPLQSFIQCFTKLTHSPDLLSLPNTPSYRSILLSSVQNQRFLLSPTILKPSLIVSAANEPHVQAAVVCARTANLHLRTRSGGHDYEGMSYSAAAGSTTPFITLDISALRSISLDANLKTAWIQAGATVGELYYAIAKNNATTAFPAGVCPTVGIGGHFTGGGIGTLTRKFGTAADNILDARLVDAHGGLLDRNEMGEDLFWAVRGAGSAGFGIVVAFKIRLVTVPPVVTAFNLVKTLRQNATGLVARWQEIAHQLDVNLFIRVVAERSREADGTRTMHVTFNSLYLGRSEGLLAVMRQSFPELGLTAADCNQMSWLESVLFFNGNAGNQVETLLDRKPEFNSSFKAKSDFVKKPITESGLEEIWRFMMEADMEEPAVLILDPMGGKMSEIGEDAIAFPHRKGNLYNVQYFLRWFGAEEGAAQRHLEWMRKLHAFMAPHVSSKPRAAYYNYKDIDLGRNAGMKRASCSAARVWGAMYFKGNFRRLAAVKSRVDPGNLFWNEQSVPPLKGVDLLLPFLLEQRLISRD